MKIKTFAILAVTLSLPLLAVAQSKPGVTKSQAEQAALAAVRGGKVLSGEYEMEGGKHIWSFDIREAGAIKEVWVDPVSGMVTKIRNESMSHEKSEQARESRVMTGNSMPAMSHSKAMKGITKSAAEKLALKAMHGGKVVSAAKVRRDKIMVWSVVVRKSTSEKDIWLSPENGHVLKISNAAGSAKPKK